MTFWFTTLIILDTYSLWPYGLIRRLADTGHNFHPRPQL